MAVVGLGQMGGAIARKLLGSGVDLVVLDHNPERSAHFAGTTAGIAGMLNELADVDVVVTALPNDEAVTSVVFGIDGLIDVLKTDAVHISMSTVSPRLSRKMAEEHAHAGQCYVAAPVLGDPDLAASGNLFILASGETATIERVMSLLSCVGKRIFNLGENAATANLIKLAANVLTAQTLQAFGEVAALLRKQGLNTETAFEVLTNSLFDGLVHKTYGARIVRQQYSSVGLKASLATKDLRLALATAEESGAPMPTTSFVHDRLVALTARGWPELDWSALGALAAMEAGLPIEDIEDKS